MDSITLYHLHCPVGLRYAVEFFLPGDPILLSDIVFQIRSPPVSLRAAFP